MQLNPWLLPPSSANLLRLKLHLVQVSPAIRRSTVRRIVGRNRHDHAVTYGNDSAVSRFPLGSLIFSALFVRSRRRFLSFIDCVVLELRRCTAAVAPTDRSP